MLTRRCGIPLLDNRVAPRCTTADALMVIDLARGRVTHRHVVSMDAGSVPDLIAVLREHGIDMLVCGGLTVETRQLLEAELSDIVDNVAGTADDIVPALERGVLRAGFGLSSSPTVGGGNGQRSDDIRDPDDGGAGGPAPGDCLQCRDRVCLAGRSCPASEGFGAIDADAECSRVIEAALDLAEEDQRQLCRLAELVYFCLEMGYRRLGLAFCQELTEPAEILSGVLRRFFEVVPVCCKIGGLQSTGRNDEGTRRPAPGLRLGVVACNPLGQAGLLNRHETDLNVTVGLCVGVDAIFARASRAPVTTLFVKDRSLANNPIGALYSEYYLRESLGPPGHHATIGRPLAGVRARDRRSTIATAERQPRKERT